MRTTAPVPSAGAFLYAEAAASGEFAEQCSIKGVTESIPPNPASRSGRFLSLSRWCWPLRLRFEWRAAILSPTIFEIFLSIGEAEAARVI